MGDALKHDLPFGFASRLTLQLLGSQLTRESGRLAYRDLDETLSHAEKGRSDADRCSPGEPQAAPTLSAATSIRIEPLGRGFEAVNEAERLHLAPPICRVVGG